MKPFRSRTEKVTISSRKELEELTLKQLTTIYNELTGSDLKSFKDKPTGIERTWTAVQSWAGRKGDGRKRARKLMNYDPKKGAPLLGVREGSIRARLIEMLSEKDGATLQEIMKATELDYPATLRNVRNLHRKLGYGMTEDESGRIRLVAA